MCGFQYKMIEEKVTLESTRKKAEIEGRKQPSFSLFFFPISLNFSLDAPVPRVATSENQDYVHTMPENFENSGKYDRPSIHTKTAYILQDDLENGIVAGIC